MTDEELATEYTDKIINHKMAVHDIFEKEKVERELKQAFLAGLKAKTQWHKVADGDLPKDEEWKWCISRGGYPYVAKYEELFVSWTSREFKEVMCPYAWKEIVLPELPKESE